MAWANTFNRQCGIGLIYIIKLIQRCLISQSTQDYQRLPVMLLHLDDECSIQMLEAWKGFKYIFDQWCSPASEADFRRIQWSSIDILTHAGVDQLD